MVSYRAAALAVGWQLAMQAILGMQAAAAQEVPLRAMRGFVSEETLPGLFSFRSCDGTKLAAKVLAVDDKTPGQALFAGIVEVRKVRGKLEQPVYIEFRGRTTSKNVAVTQLQRVVGYVQSCNTPTPPALVGARLYAEGREPMWRFVMTSPVVPAGGARLEVQGEKPIRFGPKAFAAPKISGSLRTYEAAMPGGEPVQVEFVEEMCADSGAETAFGARAVVRAGKRTFEGCAARF